MRWQAAWTQAMTDFRADDEEPPFADVTVRMTVPVSIGGDRVRAELSNRFGDAPVVVGHAAIGVDQALEVTFDGQRSTEIPAGESRWTDPVELAVGHGDHVEVDLYLPEPTPYATANGFRFQRSTTPGDVVGSRRFPAGETGLAAEGTGWSLPSGGPFLRAVEVAGTDAGAVIVCLGASITTMGWPQLAAAMLPAEARIAVLNRGIPGNRLRHDAPPATPSWGRSGLSRFDDDVLGTSGVTHVVLAHAGNDIGLPGDHAPLGELPTAGQQIGAYRRLVDRASAAGLGVLLATITPMAPEQGADRERIRATVNDWIRTSGHEVADFDAAIRSTADPTRIAAEYDVGDHQHPNVTGENRLARAMAEAITRSLR
ncbi:GDSL-type esterase/lipase family protein [Amycolatopsis sp., V23-08]|uniref:GDSL-type esterase/lipase family protein n=1 Tax=Amycolatopsis heterodermiae TaxID=3110235 RepID=A0ABU5RP81_9PSEU|nr:GDSL-type esterase/lipase family protein [Amycolatopsis sp., V23-08]MEA5367375.1 GDSL-type esterase/lipase family protein [Amycolatopsis sp., V23-08]